MCSSAYHEWKIWIIIGHQKKHPNPFEGATRLGLRPQCGIHSSSLSLPSALQLIASLIYRKRPKLLHRVPFTSLKVKMMR